MIHRTVPILLSGVLVLTSAQTRVPARADAGFDIVITVDDLPAHGDLPVGTTRLAIADSYLATLKRHHIPEAFGFVNASKLEREPGNDGVLGAWRGAGYPLGNHTFSHLNLDRAPSLEAWEADTVRGEPAVERHMRGADWRWLRFPNLAAGTDPVRHDSAAAWLAQRGYRIADVSVAFSDWSYTDAYVRCLARHDDAAIARMKADYLGGVDQGIASMKAISHRVYGRMVPQVLLTHLGGWSALMLPEVMARLDAAGARYITLAKAEADPVYAAAETIPGGGSIMERTARSKRIDLDDIPRASVPADLKQRCR